MELIIAFILISFSYEDCYDNCKTCFENSLDFKNMKCIKCKDDLNFIFNTFNCDYKEYYLNYYLNKSDSILYPCSLLENQNCYECDPYLNTKGKCLSCNKGFIFNNETNECQRCKENEIPIIKVIFIIVAQLINMNIVIYIKLSALPQKIQRLFVQMMLLFIIL